MPRSSCAEGDMGALASVPEGRDGFEAAREQFKAVVAFMTSREGDRMSHSDMERFLQREGTELLRRMYQGYLDQRGPGEALQAVRAASGLKRPRQRLHQRSLETSFGTVEINRFGYGAEGQPSLHPLDGELNLPAERYSLEVRRQAAERAAVASFDETVRSVRARTGAQVPKRQVEQLVARAGNAADFEQFYTTRPAGAGPSGAVLVISADGKGVVMRPEAMRARTRQRAAHEHRKLSTRLSKGEKRHRKRMATVAAVYTIAPFVRTPEQVAGAMAPVHAVAPVERPRPEHKRVWASLEQQPEEILAEAFREAEGRDARRGKQWVALVDGDPRQLQALKKLRRRRGGALTIVLDIIHVVERLWDAAHALYGEASAEGERWVTQRLLEILKGRAPHVAAGMRRSATLRQLPAAQRKPVDKSADYLLHYKPYLHYDTYLAAGYPIATGVIEGACRHLIKDRMDLTGARWGLAGAQAVLRLRALRASGDFEAYWTFHEEQELRRTHLSAYADQRLPRTRCPPRRNTPLTLINS
jgi:hypothetical protein